LVGTFPGFSKEFGETLKNESINKKREIALLPSSKEIGNILKRF
jgi:hypothetical protein